MDSVIDAAITSASAFLSGGVIGVIAGVLLGSFGFALIKGAANHEDAMVALELGAITEAEQTVEDAIRAGIIRGYMEGGTGLGARSYEQRRHEARRFAAGYLSDRRKLLAGTAPAKPQPSLAS